MDIEVSVIIPVYNAEIYLQECIDSLKNQELSRCEFIFIDDGSPDDSRKIIEENLKTDSRIKLIVQGNKGVSIARNNGLKVAKGAFISFVDADDYIDKDMLEVLYNKSIIENLDLIICNYKSTIEGHDIYSNLDLPKNQKLNKEFIENNIYQKFIEGDTLNSVCNKLYKKSIILENKILFPQNVTIGEDAMFNINYILNVNNLMFLDFIGYYYREVENSATRNILDKDYFKYALNTYNSQIFEEKFININKNEINKMKMKRLIDKVISNIYIYLKPNKLIGFSHRYKYVNKMIKNDQVIKLIPFYIEEYYKEEKKYRRWILKMILNQCTIGLYILTVYSWLKNRK